MGVRETAAWSWSKWLRTGMQSTVARNAASLYLIQFANYIVPLIMVPYLVRVLGPAGYGAVAFAQGFINYLMLFVEYGFDWSATRKISVQRENLEAVNHTALHVWAAKGLLAVAGFVVLLALTALVPKLGEVRLLLLALYGMVLGNVLFPTWLFQGMERMVAISLINLAMKLGILAGVFLLVRRPEDAVLYAGLLGGGSFLAGMVGAVAAFQMFNFKILLISRHGIKETLVEGWKIFLSRLSISLYDASRVFVVGLFATFEVTGYYAVAEKIARALQAFLAPFLQAIYPRLSKLYELNPIKAYRLTERLQQVVTITYSVLILIALVLSRDILRIVAGNKYLDAHIPFAILLISVAIINANALRVQYFLVAGKYDIFLKIHSVAATIGFTMIIFMTYFYNVVGAAISVLITEICVLFLSLVHYRAMRNDSQVRST